MADENNEYFYSCNEELDLLEIGNSCVELTGGIIKYDVMKKRQGNSFNVVLVRAVFTNFQGRKLRLLIWPDRKDEFEGRILNQVVTVSCPTVQYTHAQYYNPNDDLMKIELSVNQNTSINVIGPIPGERLCVNHIPEVASMKDLRKMTGSIVIIGFIKTQIRKMYYGKIVYGGGVITDLEYYLTVNVTHFVETLSPEAGTKVKICGKIRIKYTSQNSVGTAILQVDEMRDITVVDDGAKLPMRDLIKGIRPIPQCAGEVESPSGSDNTSPLTSGTNSTHESYSGYNKTRQCSLGSENKCSSTLKTGNSDQSSSGSNYIRQSSGIDQQLDVGMENIDIAEAQVENKENRQNSSIRKLENDDTNSSKRIRQNPSFENVFLNDSDVESEVVLSKDGDMLH